jgi:uncharacterized membrane protein (UPF0127 family)
MRLPIDVIVLDRTGHVVQVRRSVPPNRIVFPARSGHATLELSGGAAANVEIGDRVALEPLF